MLPGLFFICATALFHGVGCLEFSREGTDMPAADITYLEPETCKKDLPEGVQKIVKITVIDKILGFGL